MKNYLTMLANVFGCGFLVCAFITPFIVLMLAVTHFIGPLP